MHPSSGLLILAVFLAALPGIADGAMRGLYGVEKFYCNGSLVSSGETREDVLDKCGEPAWRDRLSVGGNDSETGSGGAVEEKEEWIYDFGHSQLMEYLRFRNDKLVALRSGIHGFGGSRGGDCGYGTNLMLGDSKLEVVAKCGEPTGGGSVGEPPLPPEGTAERRRELLTKDQWVYDFGPERFVHYLIFRHGRLMEIRSGGFGR